jgi:hypothetical protein
MRVQSRDRKEAVVQCAFRAATVRERLPGAFRAATVRERWSAIGLAISRQALSGWENFCLTACSWWTPTRRFTIP